MGSLGGNISRRNIENFNIAIKVFQSVPSQYAVYYVSWKLERTTWTTALDYAKDNRNSIRLKI